MGKHSVSISAHPFWKTLVVIVLGPLICLALKIAATIDPELAAERIRTAFETRELGTTDYLPFDSRRGWHQYDDCTVLQMLSNRNPSRLVQALAPITYA